MTTSRGPSPHLSWTEVACRDGTPYPPQWRPTRLVQLAREFERIRSACGGRPIVVNSAYRTPRHNRAVGGSPRSQHLEGRALDLQPPAGMLVKDFYRAILDLTERPECRIRAVGLYSTFVHVDIRPVERVVRFTWPPSPASA